MFDVKERDMPEFIRLCKQYGVLFSVIKNSRDAQSRAQLRSKLNEQEHCSLEKNCSRSSKKSVKAAIEAKKLN